MAAAPRQQFGGRGYSRRLDRILDQRLAAASLANQRAILRRKPLVELMHELASLTVRSLHAGFDPSEPRDEVGRWTDSGAAESVDRWHESHPRGNVELHRLARDYVARVGLPALKNIGQVTLTPERGVPIAEAYEAAKSDPNDPEAQRAYSALRAELREQYKVLTDAGYRFEPWNKPGQPYANSKEMRADVNGNKHLYYFKTSEGNPPHELLPAADNDLFRCVHDVFGHARGGNEFGPKGETNAWLDHLQMFSKDAGRALTTETIGQNAWFNFSKHNEGVPIPKRDYAEQKAMLLPDALFEPIKREARLSIHAGRDIHESTDLYGACPLHPARRVSTHAGFDPNEPRDPKGEWTDSGGGSEPEKKLDKAAAKRLDTWVKRTGYTVKAVSDRLRNLLRRATPANQKAGKEFYRLAHDVDVAKLHQIDPQLDEAHAAGVMAACSPQTEWKAGLSNGNQMIAANCVKAAIDDHTLTISPEQARELYEIDLKSKQPARHAHPLNAADYNGVDERFHGENFTGHPIAARELPADVIAAFHPIINSLRDTATKAIKIVQGTKPEETLKSLKVNSFYHNLKDPDDPHWVTLDSHMIRAMADQVGLKEKDYQNVAGNRAHYEYMADIMRQVAKENGLTPDQAQAICWLQWREEHPRLERRAAHSAEEPEATSDDPEFWNPEEAEKLRRQDNEIRRKTKVGPPLPKGPETLGTHEYNPDEPRDERGRWTRGGVEFYSPSKEEGLSFDEARERVKSESHEEFRARCDSMDRRLGLEPTSYDAIGDWSDGAENSVLTELGDSPTLEEIRYSAAMKGLVADQKAVIAFKVQEGGPDSVYRFRLDGDLKDSREKLDEAGIEFRTLVERPNGADVTVFDPGTQLTKTVGAFAGKYGLDVEQIQGRGEFIGGDTREEGHAAYRNVIANYERAHPQRDRPGQRETRRDFHSRRGSPAEVALLTRRGYGGFDVRWILEND